MTFEGSGKKPISVGPWGGQGGGSWDDGVYTAVRQLIIIHGAAVDSIKIEYDRKGSSVWSEKHGGSGGVKTDRVQLGHPEEILTSLSGHYGSITIGGPIVVRSLRLESNKMKYGPFGVEVGTHFSFPMTGGKIVGFHGRAGWYLDSIGVYLKHLNESNLSKALVPSQSLVADKSSYGIVQGSVGNSYDIVAVVKEKEEYSNKILLNNFSSQASLSQEVSGSVPKNKLVALPGNSNKESSNSGGPMKYGPWGGNGGSLFDDGTYTGVRKISLTRNAGVASIKVQYDNNGLAIWGNRHGGSGGIITDKIVFDYPFEILTYITGYYGAVMFMGRTAIRSLTFHTTKGKYGPYGDEQGSFFSSVIAEGMVVGFHGRKGWYLDSIGVHVLGGKLSLRPQPSPKSSFKLSDTAITEVENPQWSNKLVLAQKGQGEEVAFGVVKETVPFGPGPWGGDGGRPWDDGVFCGIKQIFLTRREAICSIQIEYDKNGQSIWSTRHGGSEGVATHTVKFEYPNEVLNCIAGYYGPINRDERSSVIKSLTFYTSRGKYGPFGEEMGTFFTSTTTEGKVVGFHGRSGLYLDSIGVHMQHWLGDTKRTKSVLSKLLK